MKYMFRRTLLEDHGEKAVDELVDYCMQHDIESCMIVTESHDQHPFPRHLKDIEKYCNGILSYAISSLKKKKIETGINVWFTLGWGGGNKDFDKDAEFNWEKYVDWKGVRSKIIASPRSAKWHQYIHDAYYLFASINPDYIFIDDDFRLHNHGICNWGSFDELTLKRFSAAIGKDCNREMTLELIFNSYGKGSTREIWFGIQNEAMVEAAQIIREAVNKVNENIPIGLMSSTPEVHSAEGRNWKELLRKLAGKNYLLNRPTMGNYREIDYKNLADSYFLVSKTIHHIGLEARYCAEVENAQGGLYGKSATMLRAQMRLAILAGCEDITLNLYDFLGQPLDENLQYNNLLKEEKPILEQLQLNCLNTKVRGIQVVCRPDAALSVAKPKDYEDLVVKSPWEKVLGYLGIGTTFADEPIKVISGDILRNIPLEILEKWFSKGVLLDGSAAFALNDMGLSKWTGVHVADDKILSENIGNEQIDFKELGPIGRRLSTRHLMGRSYMHKLKPLKKARTMSTLWYDLNYEAGPGMVWYENELGGRVATIAYDGQSDIMQLTSSEGDNVCFYNQLRQKIMKNTLNYISDDNLLIEVEGGAYIMPIRRDGLNHSIIALQTFHSDDFEVNAILKNLPDKIKSIDILDCCGKWQNYPKYQLTKSCLILPCIIPHGQCCIFRINYGNF